MENKDISLEEAVALYGEIPIDIPLAPENHNIEEAIANEDSK